MELRPFVENDIVTRRTANAVSVGRVERPILWARTAPTRTRLDVVSPTMLVLAVIEGTFVLKALDQEDCMAAYFILTHTIRDTERYQKEYIPGVLPFLAKYKGEVVVAEFQTTPLQGNPAKGAVVIRFPSEQAIRDFLDDPQYKPLKDLRISITTDANAVMAPEFKMPPR